MYVQSSEYVQRLAQSKMVQYWQVIIYDTNTKQVIDKLETLRIEKKDIEVDLEQL